MRSVAMSGPQTTNENPIGHCLPPANTPAGSVHWLSAEGDTPADVNRVPFKATWDGEMWNPEGCARISVRKATACGFRYVGPAEEPKP